MKMQPCPNCNGTGVDGYEGDPDSGLPGSWNDLPCYVCEGTGTIPDEPVSHCQACGEPVELGREWCHYHRPASDLWQALNQEPG